jgi:hypothetical protein
MRSHFIPASGSKTVKSHFISGAAIACAVTGVTALMPSTATAQFANDSASTYGSWTAGSTGGTGFGAWSFDGTSGGGGQTLSSAGAIGTAWTMYTTTTGAGISDVGRSITENGGLGVGQMFQAVIQNPTSYHYFGGFDILFLNATDNNAGGDNTSAIRAQDFHSAYFNPGDLWSVQDNGGGNYTTSRSSANTGASGVQVDLFLNSATAYTLTLKSLNGSGYSQINGTYSGPINYVNFRMYDGVGSTGPNDVADNFGISSMEVVPEPTSMALYGLGFGGLLFLRRRK